MDEPTAALTHKEINRLFEIIRRLKQRGVTIIYISIDCKKSLKLENGLPC